MRRRALLLFLFIIYLHMLISCCSTTSFKRTYILQIALLNNKYDLERRRCRSVNVLFFFFLILAK